MKNSINIIKNHLSKAREIETSYLQKLSELESMEGLLDTYRKDQRSILTKNRADELWKLYPEIENAYSELEKQYNADYSIWKGKDKTSFYQLLQLVSFGVQPPKEMYADFTKDNRSLEVIESLLKKNNLKIDDTQELKRMTYPEIIGNNPLNDLYFASRNTSKQSENGNIFNTLENRINLLSSEIGENSETE